MRSWAIITVRLGAVCLLVALLPTAGGQAKPLPFQTCSRTTAASSMVEFLTAFNVGDQIRLRHVFAEPGQFKWYSVGSQETGENFAAYDIGSLLRYFKQRHSAGEHFGLMEFKFRSKGITGHFQYRLMRWANDIRNATPFAFDGKGSLRCTAHGGRIIVWSMGSA